MSFIPATHPPLGTKQRLRGGANLRGVVVLVGTALAAAAAGSSLPALPTDVGETPQWVRTVGAPVAALAVTRVLVLLLLVWLTLTTVVALTCRAYGSARAIRWSEWLLTPLQRRALGVGLTVGVALSSPAMASATTAQSTDRITMTLEEAVPGDPATSTTTVSMPPTTTSSTPSTTTTSTSTTAPPAPPATADLFPTQTPAPPLPADQPEETSLGSEPADAASPSVRTVEIMTVIDLTVDDAPILTPAGAVPTATTAPPATDAPAVWTIQPGDHLWAVAQQTLRNRSLDSSDEAAASYLQVLIDANRAVFAVPGEADLVYPGQVFELPPLPSS